MKRILPLVGLLFSGMSSWAWAWAFRAGLASPASTYISLCIYTHNNTELYREKGDFYLFFRTLFALLYSFGNRLGKPSRFRTQIRVIKSWTLTASAMEEILY